MRMTKTYLDNAATTFPKPRRVLEEMNFCLKKYCGNPGRSSHDLSLRSSEAIYFAREKIAKMLGVNTPEQIVFTYNATYALNIAIKTIITEKCHVLISDFEHNSVVRPLEHLRETLGIEYSTFNTDGNITLCLKSSMRPDTRGIVCSIASNVIGKTISLKVLSDFARENSLFLIIDASQALGHTEIDLSTSPCDALCGPGHKALFGIQGSGFVYFNNKTRSASFIEGGSGTDSASKNMPLLLPEGYEAGTLSTPAIVSLSAGVKFIEEIGIREIRRKLNNLTDLTYDSLSSIDGVKIYKQGCGIISFNLRDESSSKISALLNEEGIYVRGGLHCAPSVHEGLGTTDQGTVRVSFSYLNKIRDVDRLYLAMKKISANI